MEVDSHSPSEPVVHEDANERIIEGISNEVTLVVSTLFVVGIASYIIYSRWKNSRPAQKIHPTMAAAVEEFREVLERVNAPMPEDEGVVRNLIAARARDDRECPICFNVANFAAMTNCGHRFCVECIIGYWRHAASPLSPIGCAVCRTPITMLLPVGWDAHAADEEGLQEANLRIDDYNRRFCGERPWLDLIWDIPVIIPYILENLTAYSAMVMVFRIRTYLTLAALLIYILSPLDMMPESVYGIIGFLDDIFIAALCLFYLASSLRNFMAHRGEVPLVD